jgi:uncharacterized protein
MREYELRVLDTLEAIAPAAWDALTDDNPTLKHAWLQSMIDAGCTTAKSGWLPQFVTLTREVNGHAALVGAVPMYMKGHSYGEYVFDWAWAEAYQRAGLDYFPKLLVAIPFTPCGGGRILARTEADRNVLIDALLQIAKDSDVSSLHVLFPSDTELTALARKGLMPRTSVQFHWRNAGYKTFDDFLATMSHDKRKKVKQERRKVVEAGITFQRKTGQDIAEADWDFFHRCYTRTYQAHYSTPYLNRAFFRLIGERMPEHALLVIAEHNGSPIAASFNLINASTLFGRYWGTMEFHSGLHFETCYYQTLEFCIERGIQLFEGGAQGEHKLARGFMPQKCHSAHWLKEPRFAEAVNDFLRRERGGIESYVNELEEHQPFKAANEPTKL